MEATETPGATDADEEVYICGRCGKEMLDSQVYYAPCWGCWERWANNLFCSQTCFDLHFGEQGCPGASLTE